MRKPEPEVLRCVREEMPPPPRQLQPDLPADLDAVCRKCLAKKPEDRYESAAQLADDLDRYLSGQELSVRPWSWGEWVKKKGARYRTELVYGSVSMLIVFLSFAIAVWWVHQRDAHTKAKKYQESINGLRKTVSDLSAKRLGDGSGETKALLQELESLLQSGMKLPDISDPELLEELAQEYEGAAKTLASRGMPERAEDAWRCAEDYYVQAKKYGRTDGRFRLSLAIARSKLERGKLNASCLNTDAAKERYKEAETAAKAAMDTEPSPELIRLLADVIHHKGELLRAESKWDGAITAYNESIDLRKSLLEGNKNHPDANRFTRDLARGHGFLGDVYLERGGSDPLFREAKVAYDQAQDLRFDLVVDRIKRRTKEPTYDEAERLRFELVVDRIKRCTERKASEEWGIILDLLTFLQKGDPEKEEAWMQLARTYSNSGYYYIRTGNPENSICAFRKAVQIQNKLAANYPDEIDYLADQAGTSVQLARMLIDHGKMAGKETSSLLETSLKASKKLREVRKLPDDKLLQAHCHLAWAKHLLRTGDGRERAKEDLDTAKVLTDAVYSDLSREQATKLLKRDLFYAMAVGEALRAATATEEERKVHVYDALQHLDVLCRHLGYTNKREINADSSFIVLRADLQRWSILLKRWNLNLN
jgi:hypothetical protein